MLATLMVGRDIVLGDYRSRSSATIPAPGKPLLSLKNVSALDDNGRPALSRVDLEVCAGEILGIAGVAGNGQRELSQVLTGLRPIVDGVIQIDGATIGSPDPATFTRLGVGHIPEDRLRSGLAPSLSVTDNAVLREYKTKPVSRGPLFNPRAAKELSRKIAAAAEVMVPDFGMPVRNLSGGNQQRLVARREMRIADKVLVAAYPSRGLDVGAINTMLRYFVELRDAGVAVILISEELEELLNLSDRISVLYEGRIMGTFTSKDANMETIGLLMGGRAQHALASVQ
jgi:simple sugar transport system ATP-binding protein